jgi:Rrf2 family transcriptional regulator, nitric oxide-sensitive transcriptional repressor
MQVTQFTDFALRTLLYLAAHRDRLVPVTEISAAYAISNHHLVKVAHQLVRLGYVEATRGRGGGLRLAREPAEISVGQVIRDTEPHLNLVECFDRAHNTCPIVGACGLKRVLAEAQSRFFAVLDAHHLSDLVREPAAVDRLLKIWGRVGGEPARSQV